VVDKATCNRAYRGRAGYDTCQLPPRHAGEHGPRIQQHLLPLERCPYVDVRRGRCVLEGTHALHRYTTFGGQRLDDLIEFQRGVHATQHTEVQAPLEACQHPVCHFYAQKMSDRCAPYSYPEYLEARRDRPEAI
jgi:hypothetical protein